MSGLVSIIVPVYRAESYIAETIAMVVRQTYKEWELLLIDDHSPDNGDEVIRDLLKTYECRKIPVKQKGILSAEEYTDGTGRRIVLVSKEKNEGAATARNIGLDMAQGRYIAFLDADDVWFPRKLDCELRFMEDKQAGFVFTAYEFGDENAHTTGKKVHVPESLTYRKALSRTVIFTTTVMFDRKIIPDKLMRMPSVESEDTATWWQILRAGYTAYGLNETLAIYRRPPKSLSSNKFTAIKRIWNLYRRQEKLSVLSSARYFILWAYRATVRRL
ncbi:MAG: glycosyltransferase family 2 protein [Lachnospiraceae bacterium]|nr:glycosyltransferase family 2 protein [Lachnospiraceae bacterium]